MEKLRKELIDELLNQTSTPAVTIYIPMHTTASPPHITENQIRFKNLINKAGSLLEAKGEQNGLAQKLHAQLDMYRDSLEFWESQTAGLLICANPDAITMIQLPIDTEEYVAVDDQFHLAPILGLIEDAREFYVLALAQQKPKLFRGDMYGLKSAGIDLPGDKIAALNIDENNQKSENQGTAAGPSTQGAASSPGAGRGWFNGRGGARNPEEEDRMKYFRKIDAIVTSKPDTKLPIILAGIDSEIAEYRNISKHPKILTNHIAGNHTETATDELFKLAASLVNKELIEPSHRAAIDEFNRVQGANPNRVAEDQESVISAAKAGRVDKLLTGIYNSTSDTVRDSFSDVIRITFPKGKTSRIINQLAAQVWQMRGKVINLLPEQVPNHAVVVARLRY
jgi:hypothetical protein